MPACLQRVFFAGCLVAAASGSEAARSVRVWRSPSSPKDKWPEDDFQLDTASLGIALSGGGSRSYAAAMGQLRALHDMGVLSKARYLTGVSGGAWATVAYTYAQTSEDDLSDEEFLGEVEEPEDITLAKLSWLDKRSARISPTNNLKNNLIKEAFSHPLDEAWNRAVHKTMLEPHGIEWDALFSWTAETRDDSIHRNPSLGSKTWQVVKRRRPYPIIVTTILGPPKYQPQAINNFVFVQSEVTPLYAGVPYDYSATWNPRSGLQGTSSLGGLVEPIGYDSARILLDPLAAEGLLKVQPRMDFTLARGAGQSSFAPAAAFSIYLPTGGELSADHINYFSPSKTLPVDGFIPHKPPMEKMVIGDGGNTENTGIFPLLRRGVKRIIMFYNTAIPLDPVATEPALGKICEAFASLWGVYLRPNISIPSPAYVNTQVFKREELKGIVAALQDSQASGKGAVTTVELTTVENERFGIAAGITTKLTILYTARSSTWEARLPTDVRDVLEKTNRFSKKGNPFPFYSTVDVVLTKEKVNLLATFSGWTVKENAEEFQDIIVREDVLV